MAITFRGRDKNNVPVYQIDAYYNGQAARERFHGTKKAAEKRHREMIQSLEGGLNIKGSKQTFTEYAHAYLEERAASNDISQRSLKSEAYRVEKLVCVFGSYRLCDITAQVIDKGMKELKTSRKKGTKPLSGSTMNGYFKLMNTLMERAFLYDLIRKNPCKLAKKPKNDTEQRIPLTEEQAKKLHDAAMEDYRTAVNELIAKENRQIKRGKDKNRSAIRGLSKVSEYLSVVLILYTGFRHAEVLGLQWCDIDFRDCTVEVVRTVERDGTYKPPKSEAGNRKLYLTSEVIAMLKEWKGIQAAQLAKMGLVQKHGNKVINSDGTTIICSDTGGVYGYNNLNRFWRSYRERFGISQCLHDLRHTFLTIAHNNGTDYKTLQTIAGHAGISLTMSVYVHNDQTKGKEAAERVAAVYSEPKQNTPIIPWNAQKTG